MNEVIRAKISPKLKHSVERVLDELGMSMTEAIRLFLTQISLRQEFPLELKIPNQTTLQAISATPTDTQRVSYLMRCCKRINIG